MCCVPRGRPLPIQVYFAITTLTTVGYGDITPKSNNERSFLFAAMVFGGACSASRPRRPSDRSTGAVTVTLSL
jgi:hypothetical protein